MTSNRILTRTARVLIVAAALAVPAVLAQPAMADGTVSGTVLDGSGNPFPATTAGVGACPVPGTGPGCPGLQSTSADAAGNYVLALAPGTYNMAGFHNTPGGLVFSPGVTLTVADGDALVQNFTV